VAASDVARLAPIADLFLTVLRGVAADGLLTRGYAAADDLDFRQWLTQHGAAQATVDGPIVSGMYDLVFGYDGGDRHHPAFSAGLGLQLANRMFFEYRGAIFWKMRAGMGDVVFAPLYTALRQRGVRFAFFHRLDALHVASDGASIGAITMGRQVALAAGVDEYEPLVRVKGLPVFPTRPDLDQLDAGPDLYRHDLESHACAWPDAAPVHLEAGRDYDSVVLAVSLGMVPHTCQELMHADGRWQAMVDHVATVPTHAWQVWLRPDERSLGWQDPAATVTGLGAPFDTFSSMSHTVPFEDWPPGSEPLTAASFCGVHGGEDVAAEAERFLDERAHELWPALLSAPARDLVVSQYCRVNTDPSDQYVQSRPGTGRFRLAAGDSGFTNLALAGDWIDSGLNAGCIEAAALAGRQAADAIEASLRAGDE
jgi:uncharacterized protein with NAD-binding domain and iron-sulfur cluster